MWSLPGDKNQSPCRAVANPDAPQGGRHVLWGTVGNSALDGCCLVTEASPPKEHGASVTPPTTPPTARGMEMASHANILTVVRPFCVMFAVLCLL